MHEAVVLVRKRSIPYHQIRKFQDGLFNLYLVECFFFSGTDGRVFEEYAWSIPV